MLLNIFFCLRCALELNIASISILHALYIHACIFANMDTRQISAIHGSILDFAHEVREILQVCDAIWDEYPSATRLSDVNQNVQDKFDNIFTTYIGLLAQINSLPSAHQHSNNSIATFNIHFICYHRRVLEWNGTFRRQVYQIGEQFDAIHDFLPNQAVHLETHLRFFLVQNGISILMPHRDHIAFARATSQDLTDLLMRHQSVPLPASTRRQYGLAPQARIMSTAQKRQAIQDMLRREHIMQDHEEDEWMQQFNRLTIQQMASMPETQRLLQTGRLRIQHNGNTSDEPFECGICLTIVHPSKGDAYFKTKCNHRFCLSCIQRWIHTFENNTCPLCRNPI